MAIGAGSPFALLEQLICPLSCSLLQKAAAAEQGRRQKTRGVQRQTGSYPWFVNGFSEAEQLRLLGGLGRTKGEKGNCCRIH